MKCVCVCACVCLCVCDCVDLCRHVHGLGLHTKHTGDIIKVVWCRRNDCVKVCVNVRLCAWAASAHQNPHTHTHAHTHTYTHTHTGMGQSQHVAQELGLADRELAVRLQKGIKAPQALYLASLHGGPQHPRELVQVRSIFFLWSWLFRIGLYSSFEVGSL